MNTFARGARVRVPQALPATKSISAENPITLGECIFVLMDLSRKRNPDVTKEQLLNLVSKAWDAYAEAESALNKKANSL